VRCGSELVAVVEKPPVVSEKPVEPRIVYSFDEYIRRLEDGLCLALRELRKRAGLQQKQVAERGKFGARSYVSKVENPLGATRTIPNLHSIEKFAMALNVEMWKIMAMAERAAGKPEQDEWISWWSEMVPWLKRLRRNDRDEILVAARRLKSKKSLPVGHEKD
jgi:transcriptional regulator with XRE-family HTH domain